MSRRKKNVSSRVAKGFVATFGLIITTTAAYYKWAAGLKSRKMSVGAMAAPPVLLLLLMIGSGADSSPLDRSAGVEPDPITESAPIEPIESIAASPDATYPVTVTRSGLDFSNTFDGIMEVYPDKTVVVATWTPECGDTAPVAQQTQKFTHTMLPGSFEIKTAKEFSDCMNNRGALYETGTYQIDSDGTIRVDLIDDDGSLIRQDFTVIRGGPAPEVVVAPELDLAPEPEEEVYYEPETDYASSGIPAYSTCKDYNDAGYGNFVPGDPEYTSRRDRDNDGIACEF